MSEKPTELSPVNRFKFAIDAIGMAGAASVVEGVREFSRPAAWIVGGAFALAFAWQISKANAVEPNAVEPEANQ